MNIKVFGNCAFCTESVVAVAGMDSRVILDSGKEILVSKEDIRSILDYYSRTTTKLPLEGITEINSSPE